MESPKKTAPVNMFLVFRTGRETMAEAKKRKSKTTSVWP